VGAELTGVAPMFYITFQKDAAETHRKRRDDFYSQLIRKGIFLHPHHHGYISYRHTDQDLDITAQAIDEALAIARKIGYPLMVRPSYVLGGRAMEVVHDDEMLRKYVEAAVDISPERPILIDKF
jgi:biotin carboxylase